MILASHNSWSYAKPKKWYMFPFRFLAKCQGTDIIEQWFNGVRMYDLRVHFDNNGGVKVRHGIMTFSISYSHLMNDLAFLNGKAKDEDVYVRVILEQNRKSEFNQEHQEWHFIRFCHSLEEHFVDIRFIEGVRKYDWHTLYTFKANTPNMKHLYSSTTSMFNEDNNKWYSRLDDWWPWLYAHRHNKSNCAKYSNFDGYLMIDFV